MLAVDTPDVATYSMAGMAKKKAGRPKANPPKRQTAFRLSDELLNRVAAFAARHRVSSTTVVELALDAFLKANESKPPFFGGD